MPVQGSKNATAIHVRNRYSHKFRTLDFKIQNLNIEYFTSSALFGYFKKNVAKNLAYATLALAQIVDERCLTTI